MNTSRLGQYTVTYNVTDTVVNAAQEVTREVDVIESLAVRASLSGSAFDPLGTR